MRWTGEEASTGLLWGSSMALAGLMTLRGTVWGWERVAPAPHLTACLSSILHLPLPGSFHSLAPPPQTLLFDDHIMRGSWATPREVCMNMGIFKVSGVNS